MRFYDKNELKDSRIFFDKQPKKYLTYLGYLFIFIILTSGILLKYLPKNYIVKAHGTIEANDKYYITPLTTGNIIEINQKEGDVVKKGDILLTLSPGTEVIQEDEINKKINDTEKYLEIFNKFEKSLIDKTNLLENKGIEQEYYGKVEYYLTQVKEDEKKNKTISIDISSATTELNTLNNDLENINIIEYEKYLKNYERKNEDLSKKQQQKEELEKKIADNNIEISDLNILKTELEVLIEEMKLLQREIEDSEDTYKETLTEQTKIKKEEIKNKEQEIKSLNSQESTQAINIYQQLISDLGVARSQNSEKISELKSQKKIKNVDNELFNLVANKDGVVHYTTPIKKGVGIQAFQPLAQIDNGKDSKLIVESYIPAQDRSRVKVGNSVKIAVTGVNQTKYGMLQGKIIEISAGTIIQNGSEENSQLLYQIIIELNNTELKSNKDTINVQASMPVVANIIYDKETYLEWILNELNLKK